jgi:hypothetical protein
MRLPGASIAVKYSELASSLVREAVANAAK